MKITTAYSSGQLVVYLSGELDHHSARTVMDAIDGLVDKYLPRDLILDMSGVSFMDSSGIALILRTQRRQKETGGRACVENPASQPMRVIDASGIDRIVPVKGGRA